LLRDLSRIVTAHPRRRDIAALAFIFILTAIYFQPFWMRGRVFLPSDLLFHQYPWIMYEPDVSGHNPELSDAVQQHYPWRAFYKREIGQGRVPLWNPHQFCGAPFAANDQSAAYYPLNFVFYSLFEAPVAYTLLAWLHLFMAGAFAFLLLRRLHAGRAGALLGAVVFMFNGCYVAWMEKASPQAAMTWTPLVFLFAVDAIEGRSRPSAWLCAIAAAIQLTAGHLQYSVYCLFAVGAYAVVNFFVRIRDPKTRRAVVYMLLVVFLAAPAIAAVHLLPVLEIAKFSTRVPMRFEAGLFPALDFKHAINLALPDFYGNPVDGDLGKGLLFTRYSYHVTLPVLILSIAAVAGMSTKRFPGLSRLPAGFFFLLALFSAASMFGLPVYALFYYLVPGAETLKVDRIGYLFVFACSVLAGLGLRAVLGIIAGSMRGRSRYETRQVVRGVLSVVVIGMVLYMLVPWAIDFNIFTPRRLLFQDTQTTAFLEDNLASPGAPRGRVFSGDYSHWTLFPNVATALGIDDIRGYDSLYPLHCRVFLKFVQFHWGHTREVRDFGIADAPTVDYAAPLNWINVRYIVTNRMIDNPAYRNAGIDDMNVYENRKVYRRVFFSDRYMIEKDEKTVLKKIVSPDYRPEQILVMEEPPQLTPALMRGGAGGAPGQDPGPAGGYAMVSWLPGEIVLDIQMQRDALMFMSDTYYPGWHARVDGEDTEVLRANYNFRSVAVPQGRHTLRMWFSPLSAIIGLVVSFAAICFTGLGLLVSTWTLRNTTS